MGYRRLSYSVQLRIVFQKKEFFYFFVEVDFSGLPGFWLRFVFCFYLSFVASGSIRFENY